MIGITTTIPVEIVYAAGLLPVDINNLFISSPEPEKLLVQAERVGFAHNICAWIKGIYSAVRENDIQCVIAVMGGDCSNTIALGEVLERTSVDVIPFEYPLDRDEMKLKAQMDKLRKRLGTTWKKVYDTKSRLDRIRDKLKRLDLYTYRDNLVTGLENHQFLVSSSDFNGNPDEFEKELDVLLSEVEQRSPKKEAVRLGYLGVPAVFGRFYELIESLGARVVFNEVQRQFSMPYGNENIVDQYLEYTYPYDINGRLRDIGQAITERNLDGVIHYTQTFCYRQIYDIILRDKLDIPILTVEGDRPGSTDSRTAFRIETFIEMLKSKPSD